jgi:hypothetical protein
VSRPLDFQTETLTPSCGPFSCRQGIFKLPSAKPGTTPIKAVTHARRQQLSRRSPQCCARPEVADHAQGPEPAALEGKQAPARCGRTPQSGRQRTSSSVSGRSGYRKSHHPLLGRFGVWRAPRTPAHLLPDWRLSFMPPTSFTWHLAPGPFPGVIGASVSELGQIEIVGKRKDFVIALARRHPGRCSRRHHGGDQVRLPHTRQGDPS